MILNSVIDLHKPEFPTVYFCAELLGLSGGIIQPNRWSAGGLDCVAVDNC